MAMIPRRQLSALLAMPASIRPLLLCAKTRPSSSSSSSSPSPLASIRLFSTCLSRYNKTKCHNVAAFSISEYRTSQPTEITPEQLFESSFLPNAPDMPLEESLTSLFTKNPATFYYGNHDFYHLRKNTRIPEICILGRSNVGKSSVVNALAKRQTNALARISKKAGKTRSINAYGFGPPPLLPQELRGAQYKGKEDLPKYTFYLVDMPGYGFASLAEWGRNITLYLTKRAAVKGAIFLIDAEVGPKVTDWHALSVLSEAGLRTAFVITKADKIKTPDRLSDTISKLLDGVRNTEISLDAGSKWSWDREIYVTAVGSNDPAIVTATVTTARLAVARLAGLVEDKRPKEDKDRKWGGKVVSFEELMYSPSKAIPSSTSQQNDSHTTNHLENITISKPVSRYPTALLQARSFHTSRVFDSPPSKPPPPNSQELKKILNDFWSELKTSQNRPGDHMRKKKLELESRTPRPKKDRDTKMFKRDTKRFPEQTNRVQVVKENRLAMEERRPQFQGERKRRESEEPNRGFARQIVEEEVADEDEYINDAPAPAPKKSSGFGKGKGSKAKGAQKGKKQKKAAEELDPFEAQFLSKKDPLDDGGKKKKASF